VSPGSGVVKIYVSHGALYANGGGCFTGSSIYWGQVSVLTGPDFVTATPLVTGLPVSNHDHAVNGMQFDNNGDLLISVGGNTNAGVTDCAIGGIPESPLSAAVIKVHLSKPGFNGIINYVETVSGAVNNDQVYGEIVELHPDVAPYFSIYASGFRNTWDLVFTTKGNMYVTDNGPNFGFGPASTSLNTIGPTPNAGDKLVRAKKGEYFGHPNRNRGRSDYRENIYRDTDQLPIPGEVFSQKMVSFDPSTNGIVEYRANTFNGALRGELIIQKWNDQTYRIKLSEDGDFALQVSELPVTLLSLDVTVGPSGVIFGSDLSGGQVVIAKPNDASVTGPSDLVVYDIFPWRAPITGGQEFMIGGNGFGSTLSDVQVIFGQGYTATLLLVTPTRIRGLVPNVTGSPELPSGGLIDINVTLNMGSGSQTSGILSGAFQYLPATPQSSLPDARWITGPKMPIALGQVAAGLINGKLYIVGSGSPSTLVYNTDTGLWDDSISISSRPYPGDHHGAEVVGGKLYLFGGRGNSSEDKVQIYHPASNTWTLGQPLPWSAFSVSTSFIEGMVYVAGGTICEVGNCIDVGSGASDQTAKYNPNTDTWTLLAQMLEGRTHVASGSDGSKFYLFGGMSNGVARRSEASLGPGSEASLGVSDGVNTIMIYDPISNTWASSDTVGSVLTPLPQPNYGMGKAVYYKGEFYIMGGESTTNVYDKVDVYHPKSNSWRLENGMTTARHGIYPILVGERCFLAGGGTQVGFSTSDQLEIVIF